MRHWTFGKPRAEMLGADLAVDTKIRVCSFDVFDTTITRITAEPSGVFHLLHRRLRQRGLALPAALLDEFPMARIDAERQTRAESQQEEVTLLEIYQTLKRNFRLLPSTVEILMISELEEEERAARGIAQIIQLITRLRDEGRRIVFTSDTYLPKEFIRRLLAREGALRGQDELYVSSECRLLKATGRLYEKMLLQENCPPAQVLHIGDNISADVHTAKMAGIRGILFSSQA